MTSSSESQSTETTSTTIETTPVKPEYLLGDVNDDGEISVEDAQLTLIEYVNSISGLESDFNEKQKLAGDVNCDNEISVEDAQTILLYYVSNTLSGESITWDDLLGRKPQTQPRPDLLKQCEAFWIDADKYRSEAETSKNVLMNNKGS